jgi:hypothetical protein
MTMAISKKTNRWSFYASISFSFAVLVACIALVKVGIYEYDRLVVGNEFNLSHGLSGTDLYFPFAFHCVIPVALLLLMFYCLILHLKSKAKGLAFRLQAVAVIWIALYSLLVVIGSFAGV